MRRIGREEDGKIKHEISGKRGRGGGEGRGGGGGSHARNRPRGVARDWQGVKDRSEIKIETELWNILKIHVGALGANLQGANTAKQKKKIY
jgi:hypothetical protein